MTSLAVPRETLIARINRLQQEEEGKWGPQGHADLLQLQYRLQVAREMKLQRKRRSRFAWVWRLLRAV